MSDTRRRADVSSRATAPDAWDAGLHAESEAGPIAVGLSVEPSAVGVIVDAPGIGLLKLAFDLQADGTTRLSRASRRLSDGRDATLVAIDEAKVLQLEGALSRLQNTHDELTGTLTTERDEARDRAAVISEDRKELAIELEAVRAQLSSVTVDLTTERERRLDVLAERESARARITALEDAAQQEAEARALATATARAELERVTGELEALSSTSGDASAELIAARSRIAELEIQRDAERAQSSADLEAAKTELEAAKAEHARLSNEFDTATAELETHRAASAEHEKIAADLESVKAELDSARAEQTRLSTELDAATAELATLRAASPEQARVAAELVAATAELEMLRATSTEFETTKTELQRLRTASLEQATIATELEAAKAELETLQTASLEQATLSTELETAKAELETLRAAATEQSRLAAELETATAEQTRLSAELEALRAGSSDQSQLAADLETATAEQTRLAAELSAATIELEALRAGATELEQMRSAATELGEVRTNLEAELGRREESLSMAVARGDALQGQLAAAEARMGAESAATREAREVALKLKTERDEARTLARQLHAKAAAPKKGEGDELRAVLDAERQIAANLVSERDQLNLRIEALGRMIDQERDGRARALSERDEWQARFKALAKGNVEVSQRLDFSREETRSYALERPTLPETPAARAEATTDPAIKKGP